MAYLDEKKREKINIVKAKSKDKLLNAELEEESVAGLTLKKSSIAKEFREKRDLIQSKRTLKTLNEVGV